MSEQIAPRPILLMYLGRRGITQIVFDIAAGFDRSPDFTLHLAISRQNESASIFSAFGPATVAFDTFETGAGALAVTRLVVLKRKLHNLIAKHQIRTVVNLMPHVWSWSLAGTVKRAGAHYCTIVHDARPHPGDRTGLVHALLMQDARRADTVFTLSRHVTSILMSDSRIDPARIATLFLPSTGAMRSSVPAAAGKGEPWRFLFAGRLMAYKGLALFVDAIERLNEAGYKVSASIMGEGDVSALAVRIDRLGIRLVNRWLTADELAEAYRDHHAVVMSHIEASQSGVAAAAVGAGIPVIALPVGGVAEQVRHDVDGVLADGVTADALAAAMERFMTEPGLYARILEHIRREGQGHSVDRFVADLAKRLGQQASVPAA